MRRRGALALTVVVGLAALAGCGSGGGSTSEPPKTVTDGKITVGAYDIHFDVGDIKTAPGPLTITLDNHGAVQHTLKIKGTDLDLKANGGKSVTGTVDLAKGTYEFECTVPGRASQGMKGKVIVA
jgi:plastocyanin